MADVISDDDDALQSEVSSEEELEATAAILDVIGRQCRQMTQACSMITDQLDYDDDRTGDHQDGDYCVDPLRGVYNFLENMLSGHESRFFRVTGFTIAEWEVSTARWISIEVICINQRVFRSLRAFSCPRLT